MLRIIIGVGLAFILLVGYGPGCIPVEGAQASQGVITGEVRDPQGSVVVGAKITATEVGTNLSVTTTSTPSGTYALLNLRPGAYKITSEAQGFKRLEREGVILPTGERISLNLEMTLGSVSDAVTVVGDAPLLRANTGSLGQVINNRTIVDLPLNGRSFFGLIGLAAGVANPPGGTTPRINGGRPRVNEYLYDGICVLQPEPGTVTFSPIIDAIQEFKLETATPAAEFGRFNGGVINLTTKSGSNQFHGTAFYFLRNEALNARNLFAPKTAANPNKPLFRRNQFGFVFGGPIYRDKTFFFTDYQGTRQSIGRVRVSTVPTLLQRQGNFSEAIGGRVFPIFDPATTGISSIGTGLSRDQFPNNTIPTNRIDPVAAALLNRYPLPTASGTANNYSRIGTEPDDQNQFDGRVDHRFSDRDIFFARYSYAKQDTNPVTPLPDGSGTITTGVIGDTSVLGQSYVGNYVHIFNDRMSNELRFGYSRRTVSALSPATVTGAVSQALGLPGIPNNAAFSNVLPTFTINGFQQLGSPNNTSSNTRTDVTHLVDAISLQRGNHSIKFGLDYRWERLDIVQPPQPTGLFNFSTLFTDFPNRANTGVSLASFLLGQVNTFSIDLQQRKIRPRAHIQEYFVQDDWKAFRRLTVNAGVRWTLNFPSTEAGDQGAVFDLGRQQLDYVGQNDFPRTARQLHWRDFGPRLGLAYLVTEKTVVRAGFGLTWIEMAGITTPFTIPQFPFLQTVGLRTLDNINPAMVLRNGPTIVPVGPTPDAGLGQGVFAVDRDQTSGYVQQWNLAIQHEIAKNLVVEVAYVGNKVTHLGIPETNINQLTAAQLGMGTALTATVTNPFFGIIPRQSSLGNPTISVAQLLRPFPRFTTVSLYRNNTGNSNYHSFQVKVEKRLSKGLSFLVSYTRSKLLDDASSVFSNTVFTGPPTNAPVADSFNRHIERDVSLGDMPNVFTSYVNYDLPFGQGRMFNPGGVAGKIVGGWSIVGIVTLQSGIPLALTQTTNFNAFAGFGSQRPNLVGNPTAVTGGQRTAQWFNTSAFQTAPQFTIGTSSRNPVRGPAYRNTDLALIKRTPIREQMNLEFRAEVFNLTNTPPLGAPNTVLGNAAFGTISSAGDPRVIQLALKLNF